MVFLCLAAAAVMFIRLGHPVFWVDEADTACIARNILKHGLPVCWDHNFLVEAPVTKYAPGFVWNQHTWLMHYVMAASFLVGVATPLAARFPFALLGVATVYLTYLLARRAGASRGAALAAAGLLAANVQYVLFVRQARYFALLTFFTTVWFIGFLRLHKRSGLLLFILGAVGLFHSLYLTFFPIGAAFWLWSLLEPKRPRLKRLALATVVILALTIPWMFLAHVFQKRELVRRFTATGFLIEIKEYAAKFNRRAFPAVFAVIILALAACGRRRHLKFYGLTLLALAASVIFVVPISVVRSLRYLVGFFPLLAVCAAMMLEDLWHWRRRAAVATAVLFVATQVWSECAILPATGLRKLVGYQPDYHNAYLLRDIDHYFLRSEFADLYRDLRYGFRRDPLAHFIALLEKRARPGDLVVTPRYANQIDFYTGHPTMDYRNWQSEREKGFKLPAGYLRSPEGFDRIWYMQMPSVPMRGFEDWMWRRAKEGRLRVELISSKAPDLAVGNDPDLDTRLAHRESLPSRRRVRFFFAEAVKGPAG